MSLTEQFWESTEQEMKNGYQKTENGYVCLLCGLESEDGVIYPHKERLVDAHKYIKCHIEGDHGSVFEYLNQLDKKVTGMSEHQSKLLELFYKGKSDVDVQKEMGIGSISTIRNHRFALKEKERQARITVTLMSLLREHSDGAQTTILPHATATMVDDRYGISESDYAKVVKKYFPQGPQGPLKTFYVQEKHKIVLLREIAKRFEHGKRYIEKEIDDVLKAVYPEDHALIRRYLIQYGLMEREKDCSAYWLKSPSTTGKKQKGNTLSVGDEGENLTQSKKVKEDKEMEKNKKKALKQEIMMQQATKKVVSGVYQIRNLTNQKVFIAGTRNVEALNGLAFQLNMGSFRNAPLQAEWKEMGEASFVIEILESFEEEDTPRAVSNKLKEMEKNWIEKVQPFGDKGYHTQK